MGDIIEFSHPTESKYPLLKRVIACEGDTVEVGTTIARIETDEKVEEKTESKPEENKQKEKIEEKEST